MQSKGSSYIATGPVALRKTSPVGSFASKTLAMVLVLTFLATIIFSTFSINGSGSAFTQISDMLSSTSARDFGNGLASFGGRTVYADCSDGDQDGDKCNEEANEKFDEFQGKSLSDSGYGTDSELQKDDDDSVKGNWMSVVDQSDKRTDIDPTSKDFVDVFSMVFKRLMPGYYITPGLEATPDNVDQWKTLECNETDSAPTGANANCDVPSISTEAVQDLVSLVDDHGVRDATLQKSQAPFDLGFSRALLPTDDVPVDLAHAGYKYTGLEAFGYELKWTTYNGEWDRIKVISKARMKMSMGIGDWGKTAFQMAGDGVKAVGSQIGNHVDKINDEWNNGQWLGAIIDTVNPLGWIVTAFKAVSDAVASALYRLINNVMNSAEIGSTRPGSWYRPDFASETMYSVEALTDVEKNEIIKLVTADNISSAFGETEKKLPEDQEQAIRAKYVKPVGPTVTLVHGEPKDSMTWEDWEKDKANADKINLGKDELGVDPAKYDKTGDPTNKYNNMSATQKYDLYSREWDAAVERKIQEAADSADENVVKNFFDSFNASWRAKMLQSNMISRPSSAWLYCMNADGTPDGEPEEAATRAAIKSGAIRKVGKEAYGTDGTKPWQCSNPERPTIVGGLLGSSRKSPAPVDTRRTAYHMGNQLLDYLVPATKTAKWGTSAMLWFSQRVTMVMNTLVGWSFEPILDTFGIKGMLEKLTIKLRDSIYMSFLVMMIAIAGLLIIIKLVRGQPVQSFKQIGLTLLTVGLGFMLLFNTNMMFKMVDEVPTAVERAIIGTVFTASSNDTICTATGSPKHSVSASGTFSAMFGDDNKSFNPDANVRTMQCKIWEAFVLTPWSYGQFNAGWDQLWATGHKAGVDSGEFKVDDATQKLVGDAGVPLGNGQTVHNWAIYQLAHTTTGTITTEDKSRPSGTTDKNIYRLVDLQAGPNNAAGRDATHFAAWAGDPDARFMISLLSIPLSIVGLLGIGGICIKKIQYTLTVVLMLLISPIMLLFGVLPGRNQLRLKQYGFEILSLVLKRLAAVLVLAVALEVLVEIGGSAYGSWFSAMMALIIVAMCVKFFANEIVEKLTVTVNSQAGKWASANDVVKNAISNNYFLQNAGAAVKDTAVAVTGTLIGGAIAGQVMNPNTTNKIIGRFADRLNSTDNVSGRELAEFRAAGSPARSGRTPDKWDHARNLANAQLMIERYRNGQDVNSGVMLISPKARRQNQRALIAGLKKMGVYDEVFGAAVNPGGDISASSLIKNQWDIARRQTLSRLARDGRTSPLFNVLSHSRRERGDGLLKVRQGILQRMNDTAFDTDGMISKINASVWSAYSTGGSALSSTDAPVDLNRGKDAHGQYISSEQFRSLVMSCRHPYQLEAAINKAQQTGDPLDWEAVRAILLDQDGNAMTPGTDAYRKTWVNGMTDEARERLLDEETDNLVEKARTGTLDHSSEEYRNAKDELISSGMASPNDEEIARQIAKDRVASGAAAQAAVEHTVSNANRKNSLKVVAQKGVEKALGDNAFELSDGRRMTLEEAKALQDSPKNQREYENRMAEIKANTKPLRERQSQELALAEEAENALARIQAMKGTDEWSQLTDVERHRIERKERQLKASAENHNRQAREYRRAADHELEALKSKYRPYDELMGRANELVADQMEALANDAAFISFVTRGGNPMGKTFTVNVNGEPCSINVEELFEGYATMTASANAMKNIEIGEGLRQLEATAKAKSSTGGLSSNDKKAIQQKATGMAQMQYQSATAEVQGDGTIIINPNSPNLDEHTNVTGFFRDNGFAIPAVQAYDPNASMQSQKILKENDGNATPVSVEDKLKKQEAVRDARRAGDRDREAILTDYDTATDALGRAGSTLGVLQAGVRAAMGTGDVQGFFMAVAKDSRAFAESERRTQSSKHEQDTRHKVMTQSVEEMKSHRFQ